MRVPRATAVLILLAVLGGCKTAPIEFSGPITIPDGLSQSEVQLAIVAGVAGSPKPDALSANQQMIDRGLEVAFWPFYKSVAGSVESNWFLESFEPGVVLAGYQRKTHYLRVAIRFDDRLAKIEIIEARNLKYSGKRIHKQALLWIRDLEMRIRRALGQMAAFGTPAPGTAVPQPPP